MGNNTFKCLPKQLENRRVHVLSRKEGPTSLRDVYHPSLQICLETLKNENDVIVAGGAEVYAQLIDRCNTIVATEINHDFNCDLFFPPISEKSWKSRLLLDWTKDTAHSHNFKVVIYERKAS